MRELVAAAEREEPADQVYAPYAVGSTDSSV